MALDFDAAIRARFDELETVVRGYLPNPDMALLRRAFEYAWERHDGQRRKSGEPYIGHPVEVSHIAASLRLDIFSLCAALLHDVVEDTNTPIEEISSGFGEQVAELVGALTKISKFKFKSREEAQAENLRRLVVSTARDLRVLLLKLADRLHNIRTLEHMSESGQRRIAQETLDIFAPIANRLGIHWLKTELEDGAFRYVNPEAYYRLADTIQKTRRERDAETRETLAILRQRLAESGIEAELQGRPKHFFSIWRKMQRSDVEIDQIHDLTAFRIIVANTDQCWFALSRIHPMWTPVPGRFKDYISHPKPNGYQSLHTTVIGPFGDHIEVQIRTLEMHRIAEFGVAAHWAYKEGRNVFSDDAQRFQWLHELAKNQAEVEDAREFLDTLRLDLFDDEITVFTPAGDSLRLPRGATLVDFAYAIHSDIGQRCVHGRVNGKFVNLRYELHNGDRVEVETRSDQHPREEWLDFVKSSKARGKIRQYLKQATREKARELGRQMLATELKRYNIRLESVIKSGDLQSAAELLRIHNADQVLEEIGFGKLQPPTVAKKVAPPNARPADEQPQSPIKRFGTAIASVLQRNNTPQTAVLVAGLDGEAMVSYARCCEPVPGEDIVGFVTRGRGIVVHAAKCSRLQALEEQRQVPVQWNLGPKTPDGETNRRKVTIKVICRDEPGLLAEMSSALTARGVNISQAHCRSREDGLAHNLFDVLVLNVGQLNEALRQVGRIEGVVSATRVMT